MLPKKVSYQKAVANVETKRTFFGTRALSVEMFTLIVRGAWCDVHWQKEFFCRLFRMADSMLPAVDPIG